MESMITNPVTNTNSDRSKRKKKKKTIIKENQQKQNHARWKSDTQQQIYSSKLLQALSQLNLNTPSPSAPRGGGAVREAADKALAVAAKGRSRWSRAILTTRLKLKFRKQKRQGGSAAAVAAITGNSHTKKPRVILKLRAKSLPTVQRKVKVLGGLIPGCRKQPLTVLLEEATDYIAALEMQIRAMSTITKLLSGSGAASSSSAPSPLSPPSTSQ